MQHTSVDVGRRQFLKFSGVAIATVAVAPKLFAGELAGEQPKRLAVGFVALDRLEDSAVSASSISSSDGSFISRGARVTVLGAGVRAGASQRRVGELCAMYSYFDGASLQQAPVCAAAPSRRPGSFTKVASFNVPVDLDQKLSFTVAGERAVAAAGASTQRFNRTDGSAAATDVEKSVMPVTFALRNEPGAVALTRGYYFIAPVYAGDREPRWSSHSLRQVDGRWTLVDGKGEPAAFEHYVLRLDYAVSDEAAA